MGTMMRKAVPIGKSGDQVAPSLGRRINATPHAMPSAFLPILDALPARKSPLMERFWSLLEVKTPSQLEAMAREARGITRRNFGRTMRMFAPLYVSNECVNNCSYCGFSRDNASIMRVTSSPIWRHAAASVRPIARDTRCSRQVYGYCSK